MRDRSTGEAQTDGDPSVDAVQKGQSALLRLAEACLTEDDSNTNGQRIELLERILGTEACRRMALYHLPSDFQLTVIIPVFNERGTLPTVIDRIRRAGSRRSTTAGSGAGISTRSDNLLGDGVSLDGVPVHFGVQIKERIVPMPEPRPILPPQRRNHIGPRR